MRTRSMKQTLLAVLAGGSVLLAVAACDDDDDPITGGSVTYRSTMNGANERPTPNASAATGTATYTLTGNTLSFTVSVSGLTAPATGAHIHVGNATQAGAIVYPFTYAAVSTGTVATGSINLTGSIIAGGISGDSLRVLLNNGNAYTNVHTATYPDGEIRGQIVRQ